MRSQPFLTLGLVLTLALTANAQTKAEIKHDPSMAHQHSPRFLQIVNESRRRVRETNVDDVKAKLDRGEKLILVDVREESEFAKDHLPGAIHLSKGIIERDIEEKVPNLNAPLVLYCGGATARRLLPTTCRKWVQERTLDGWWHSCLAGKRISAHEITHRGEVAASRRLVSHRNCVNGWCRSRTVPQKWAVCWDSS